MRNKLFDEHVKKQFDGYRPEVAPHIWEKIAAEQARRKPAPLWLSLFSNKWMVAALLLVTATGAGVYLTHRSSGKAAEDVSTTVVKAGTPASKDNTTSSDNNTLNTTTTIAPSANSNQAVNNNTGAGLNNNLPDQSSNALPSLQENRQAGRNKNRNTSGNMRIGIDNADATVNTSSVQDRNTEIAGSAFEKILNRTASPFDLLTAKENNIAKADFKKLPAKGTIPCPPAERDAAGNKSYFEAYAGPDYIFSSFSDPANAAYMRERKATVSPGFSYSAGVRYTKVFKNGVSVRTGVNYSQANERFKYVKGNVTHNIYITNPAGDTTGTYVERGTQYQQSTNKYRSVDIPLVAGYELGNGKIHANVNAGVMINILSRQKGYVLDQSGTPVEISSGKTNSVYGYKTNAGVSFLGAVSVYYKLNDRFHLLAEPYLRYGLSSVTKTDISLRQKNHTAGLRAGLRMDL
jgi:hypothetical protein